MLTRSRSPPTCLNRLDGVHGPHGPAMGLEGGTCSQVIDDRWGSFTPVSVVFSPDGLRLIVGIADLDGRIYVYRLTGVRAAPPAEPTRRYVNAKVVLIGEGTVGKTSLAHRLIEDKYVVRDRTHGMNVWPLELPLPPDATLEREALLWDLAGQEDYRLIHRLFLDETALALLLINPQKDDPFAEAGDWLKALKTAAIQPGGQTRRGPAADLLHRSTWRHEGQRTRKSNGFCEHHGFSGLAGAPAPRRARIARTQAGGGEPSKLKQLIAEHIPWDRLPWTAPRRGCWPS